MDAENETRGLLGAYREATRPDPARKAEAWKALAAATGTATVGLASGASASSPWWKIGIAVSVVGALAGGGTLWMAAEADGRSAPMRERSAVMEITPPASSEPVLALGPVGADIGPTPAGPVVSELDPVAPERLVPRARLRAGNRADGDRTSEHMESAPAVETVAPSAAPTTGSLTDELALLGEARRAVAAGDVTGALAALARHEARFPSGSLAHEREVTRVSALCAAGQVEAADRAAQAAGGGPAITRALSRCGPR